MSKSHTPSMFGADKQVPDAKQVECLGMTFPNDEARRAYFTEKLRAKLKEGDFRKTEGFTIGEESDILAISDPPFFTACPNPFLGEFIKPSTNSSPDNYSRDPFAADVSEGKSDPIYNAHGYHTKVPHKAIMRYILHYTLPGDVVFDGFCGTGMTGVAAQLCADKTTVESLGYKAKPDGTLLTSDGSPFSKLGTRRAILGDLSPAATFIAHNYNTPTNSAVFREEAGRILLAVEAECGWMYSTLDRPKANQIATAVGLLKEHHKELREVGAGLPWGRINYSIWSDIFLCSECSGEVVFWDAAVDKNAGKVRDEFPCPHCKARLTKRSMERAFVNYRDSALNETIKQAKQVPVLINYTRGKDRLEKTPDDFDRALMQLIATQKSEAWFPSKRMPDGDECRRNDGYGITHMHHFYARRNLYTLSHLWEQSATSQHRWLVTGILQRASKQHQIAISRIGGPKAGEGGATAGHRRGTLYVPSNQVEFNPCDLFKERMAIAVKAFASLRIDKRTAAIYTGSASHSTLPDNSVDYIFTDPPFGGNIMYSELNTVWEAWLCVQTNNLSEAVTSGTQKKDIGSYTRIMVGCFQEYYRVLKPNRWITVEFHNSSNAVWTAIQEALQQAGFVVADVRMLDKQIKTHTQRTAAASVNKDLAITAYKPPEAVEETFRLVAGTEAGAWEFVRSHLRHIPVFVCNAERAEVIAERQGYFLFDRMVAFHVQRGYSVPISAAEFYAGLRQKFPERDGMYFLPDQAGEYDRQRMTIKEVEQLQLFVNDERTAIHWVRHQLTDKAKNYQGLSPLYMKEAQRVWEKHEQPLELLTILEQNFVKDADDTWRIPDPRKEADLEQLRHRALLKEFQQYIEAKGKLKIVRTEALRAGFKECWQRKDYTTIIQMAKRVPDAVIQEDPALLMYFDNALLLKGE